MKGLAMQGQRQEDPKAQFMRNLTILGAMTGSILAAGASFAQVSLPKPAPPLRRLQLATDPEGRDPLNACN
jgi:hypothetical protein